MVSTQTLGNERITKRRKITVYLPLSATNAHISIVFKYFQHPRPTPIRINIAGKGIIIHPSRHCVHPFQHFETERDALSKDKKTRLFALSFIQISVTLHV